MVKNHCGTSCTSFVFCKLHSFGEKKCYYMSKINDEWPCFCNCTHENDGSIRNEMKNKVVDCGREASNLCLLGQNGNVSEL